MEIWTSLNSSAPIDTNNWFRKISTRETPCPVQHVSVHRRDQSPWPVESANPNWNRLRRPAASHDEHQTCWVPRAARNERTSTNNALCGKSQWMQLWWKEKLDGWILCWNFMMARVEPNFMLTPPSELPKIWPLFFHREATSLVASASALVRSASHWALGKTLQSQAVEGHEHQHLVVWRATQLVVLWKICWTSFGGGFVLLSK